MKRFLCWLLGHKPIKNVPYRTYLDFSSGECRLTGIQEWWSCERCGEKLS